MFLPRIFTALLTVFSCAALSASAEDAELALGQTVENLEAKHEARIGVVVREAGLSWSWGHREDERFLMASTFKPLLCAVVLDRVDQGRLSLAEEIAVKPGDILDYAPVAKRHVGGALSVAALCEATLDLSDNTAANLLIRQLGGPQEVTAFVRRLGDDITRLDRMEPDLNRFVPGDPRDTTTPSAMLATLEKILLGEGLPTSGQVQLTEWMSHGGVTGPFLRASAPAGWQVADKSGGGPQTRSFVAMVTPPDGVAYFVAIYISDTDADWQTRNAMVVEISAAVVEVIEAREAGR